MSSLIERAERMFEQDAMGIEGAAEPALGAIYGTLSQNFGFCGPSYVERTLEYADRAMEKFGGEKGAPLFVEQARRMLNYKTYACLDAGELLDAERHLLTYLGKPSVAEVMMSFSGFSAWEHALLARFMADAGKGEWIREFMTIADEKRIGDGADGHPWQLWFYNRARCALGMGDRVRAVEFAWKSAGICESNLAGKTLNVMALLPYSLLHRVGVRVDPRLIEKAMGMANDLNSHYFKELNGVKALVGLGMIGEQPSRFFPFSYR